MKNQSLLFGLIGLLIGVVLAGITAGYSVNHGYDGMMRAMGVNNTKVDNINMPTHNNSSVNNSSMTMDEMVSSLKGKTGDDFDKAFISEMIDHHQSAIEMAKLAQQNAKHDEVKTLAGNIITAQTSEIVQMKSWQLQWGYVSSSSQPDDMMKMMH